MDDFALTPAERALFVALNRRGVPFIIIGMAAAVLQGAPAPPAFGGDDLARIDVVLTAHGLNAFAIEYAQAIERDIEGVRLRVLPLERVIASKRATGRLKDTAQLPVLEATLIARDEANKDS